MSKTVKVIIFIVIVLLLGGALVFTFSEASKSKTTIRDEGEDMSRKLPVKWQKHEAESFTFSHPQAAEVSQEAGRVKLQLLGEGNTPASEVTDGMTAYISTARISTDGSLETLAKKLSNQESHGTNFTTSTFAGKDGYRFTSKSELTDEGYPTYVLESNVLEMALIVTYTVSGPDRKQYVDDLSQMVASLTVTATKKPKKNQETNSNGDNTTTTSGSTSHQKEDDGFTATARFRGENRWEYAIAGTLPTPCYDYETEVMVAESYPEQVSIYMTITPPDEGEMCAQVIQEVSEAGTYQASAGATFSFSVDEEE